MFDSTHFHPMTVHFPIVLIILGFLFETYNMFFGKKEPCLSKIGFYLMVIGMLAVVCAFFTGDLFTEELQGKAGELGEMHELSAKITMFVMIAATLLRSFVFFRHKENSWIKWLSYILYALAAVCVGFTGLLGGTLVYNYMIR
jgi:uncharacterized membrane protein